MTIPTICASCRVRPVDEDRSVCNVCYPRKTFHPPADDDMSKKIIEHRERLGRRVRQVWMDWARQQPKCKPSWLVSWEDLPEELREVDRRIGSAIWGDAVEEFSEQLANAVGAIKMNNDRKPLTFEQACEMLPTTETIHTVTNPAPCVMLGADWDRADIIEAIAKYGAELSGKAATSANHGLVFHDGGRYVFVETDKDKAAAVRAVVEAAL